MLRANVSQVSKQLFSSKMSPQLDCGPSAFHIPPRPSPTLVLHANERGLSYFSEASRAKGFADPTFENNQCTGCIRFSYSR